MPALCFEWTLCLSSIWPWKLHDRFAWPWKLPDIGENCLNNCVFKTFYAWCTWQGLQNIKKLGFWRSSLRDSNPIKTVWLEVAEWGKWCHLLSYESELCDTWSRHALFSLRKIGYLMCWFPNLKYSTCSSCYTKLFQYFRWQKWFICLEQLCCAGWWMCYISSMCELCGLVCCLSVNVCRTASICHVYGT